MYRFKGEHGGNVPQEPVNRVAFSGAPGNKIHGKKPGHSRGGIVLHSEEKK